jgi:hypothetical protein
MKNEWARKSQFLSFVRSKERSFPGCFSAHHPNHVFNQSRVSSFLLCCTNAQPLTGLASLTPDQVAILKTVSSAGAALGIFGCCVVIVSVLLWKPLRSDFVARLLLFVTLSDLCSAFFHAFANASLSAAFCQLQGYFLQFAGLSSMFCTSLLRFPPESFRF